MKRPLSLILGLMVLATSQISAAHSADPTEARIQAIDKNIAEFCRATVAAAKAAHGAIGGLEENRELEEAMKFQEIRRGMLEISFELGCERRIKETNQAKADLAKRCSNLRAQINEQQRLHARVLVDRGMNITEGSTAKIAAHRAAIDKAVSEFQSLGCPPAR